MIGVSARASHIYRRNKEATGHYNTFVAKEKQKSWNWRHEWSKAMKEACRFLKRTAIAAAAMTAAKSAESKKQEKMMKLQIETKSYNEKRYGKPWIAKVVDEQLSFRFGKFVGEDGYAGLLVLDVECGDVIARGQKDNRNQRAQEPPSYFVVNADLSLSSITKVDAYKIMSSK